MAEIPKRATGPSPPVDHDTETTGATRKRHKAEAEKPRKERKKSAAVKEGKEASSSSTRNQLDALFSHFF